MLIPPSEAGPLRRQTLLKQLPPTPETGWRPSTTFPNLSGASLISFDVETHELDFEHGPGWARGKGYIVGFSLAAIDRVGNQGKWYFPIRHAVEPEFNIEPTHALNYLRETLETDIPKCGANLLYDMGWLTEENIFVKGRLYDVQFAEALLNESGRTALDYLGEKYLHQGKASSLLYEWCAKAYGGDVSGKQRANIWRTSPRLVGRYGEDDASLPIDILKKQWSMMEREGLLPVFDMECASIRMLIEMRRTGIRVDVDAAAQLYSELKSELNVVRAKLRDLLGFHCNVNSADQLALAFDKFGLPYPETPTGKPSFKKDYLEGIDHPVSDLAREIRAIEKIRGTFLKSYILESNINGRIHCQFHPLRGDEGGTRSGRYASSDPNLQNIPVRTELGKRVRAVFVPDIGHECFIKRDYSQIEYRALANRAVGPGSDELRAAYIADPTTDYHKKTQENVLRLTGITIERRPIKNLNFGLVYGMGEAKLARQNNFETAQAKEVFSAYHEGNPYVKPTMKAAAHRAQVYGYITTLTGRRSRFELWEPIEIDYQDRKPGLSYYAALRSYGSAIQRAYTHKAINRELQGDAADVIKIAMVTAYQAGVFDVIGVPKLQVHDELDHSKIDSSLRQLEAHRELDYIMENAVKLRVPIKIERKEGPNWGAID